MSPSVVRATARAVGEFGAVVIITGNLPFETQVSAVYIFGQKLYRPILRPAILTGFLGYVFVLFGLIVDLGQPWRLPYQFFLTPGTTAVMYEVGWCVFL